MAAELTETGTNSNLFPPGAATSARFYARRIWGLRHFIAATARGRLTARNQGMILGSLWLLLEPFLFVMVYYVIFEIILGVGAIENFFLFLTVGRLVFASHQSAVLGAAQSLSDNPALVRDTSMPKAVLPIGSTIGTFYQWGLDLIIMLLVAMATGVFPRLSWLLIAPLSFGILALNMGIGLLLSPMVAVYGDLKRALPVVFRLTFYTTGIMFPLEAYIEDLEHANLVWVAVMANPIYGFVKAMQWAVFGYDLGRPGLAIVVSIGWMCLLFPLGFFLFPRRERRVGAFRYRVGG